MAANTVGLLALVGVAGASSQWLAWKLKLPSILFLLLSGIVLGPLFGWLNADELLGDVLFPFVSIAVAIILFEGGLTLSKDEIRGHGAVVRNLLVFGVLTTWILIAFTARLLFDMSWEMASLFGAIGIVTGPTVIKPLLRIVRPSEKIAQVLHWEGILVDPLGALLAILAFNYIVATSGDGSIASVMGVLLTLLAVGLSAGAFFGFTWGYILKNRFLPDCLAESSTLIVVIAAFALSEMIQHEAGLLTVTVMGVWLANTKGVRLQEILHFKENLSILLISALFILLASRLEFASISKLGFSTIIFLITVQFFIRPLSVWLCTIGSGWNWRERFITGWIAPRGIVAAAISSLFVIRLDSLDISGSELLVPLAFVLIIGTVVFQSLTTKWVADRLNVSNPAPNGLLIVGANSVARTLGKALQDADVNVTLMDRNRHRVQEARTNGLNTFFGNVTSAHAASNLDLTPVGKIVALSRNDDLNQLAALHFKDEFGTANVFLISHHSDPSDDPEDHAHNLTAFRYLFEPGITFEILRDAISRGASVVETKLTEQSARSINEDLARSQEDKTQEANERTNFKIAENGKIRVERPRSQSGLRQHFPDAILLFAIDPDGQAWVFTLDLEPDLGDGWRILSLVGEELRRTS